MANLKVLKVNDKEIGRTIDEQRNVFRFQTCWQFVLVIQNTQSANHLLFSNLGSAKSVSIVEAFWL